MAQIVKQKTGPALTNGAILLRSVSPKLGTVMGATIIIVPDHRATFDVQLLVGGVQVDSAQVVAYIEPTVVNLEFAERAIAELEVVQVRCANKLLGQKIKQITMQCEVT
jgi:hypothetical protein